MKRTSFTECSDPVELEILQKFLKCHGSWYKAVTGKRGWHITVLNVLAEQLRAHLGLPSVDALNPELAEIKQYLRGNRETLQSKQAELRALLTRNESEQS